MNDRVRIYELARKMNLDNQDVISALRELGYDVKSHSSTIDSQAVGLLIAHIGKKKQQPAAPEGKVASVAKAAPAAVKPSGKAAPAASVPAVKPRVLARYRPAPQGTESGDVAAEQSHGAPLTASSPSASPAVQAQQAAAAALEAAVAAQSTPKVVAPEPIAPAPPKAKEKAQQPAVTSAPAKAPAKQAPPAEPIEEEVNPSSPLVPSRAVLEQRAQLEEIQRAQLRGKKKEADAAAAAKEREDRSRRDPKSQQSKESKDEGRPAGREPGQPMAPSAPGQPIRIAAPSFRATPPRPPKSHNRQPQERHVQQQQKKEEKRPAAAVVELPTVVAISGPLTVKELSEKMAQPETEVIKRLFMKGIMRTVNQMVEAEPARELALEMGYELQSQEDIDIEAAIAAEEAEPKPVALTDEEKAAQVTRPPVVTIMGHVDHGKTSLLDAIRQTKFLLTDAEHGGITQHIGAYHVEVQAEDGTLRQVVFLDTPGHEAFTAMRARGAKATDIAILVVAADDGVMPQTIEAIDHAKAANVPIIVAINKVDKSNADPDRVLTELMNHNIVPDKYGGDTVTVNVSAKKKTGLDELLEMILLVADMQDLKASPEKPAIGTIIEAELSKGKGAVATALVANGTLREGDFIVAGSAWGRVRALFDDRGERVKAAGPSMPVEVLGLDEVPGAGDRFEVVADSQAAKALAEQRRQSDVDVRRHHVTLESFHDMMSQGEVKELDIIVKADVQGTAEAIAEQLSKLSTPEVAVRVLRTASGDISETDVNLAASSNAIIIGFNVQPDANASRSAEGSGVDIRTYNIIYQAIDDLNLAIQGLLQPIRTEVETGAAEIRQIFKVGKNMVIGGCMVTSGKIPRGAIVRILRGADKVYEGKIETLKRFKDDAKEVAAGFECGMSFEKFADLQEGDVVHAFIIQETKRELNR